jgi:hypothetical protein
MTNEEFRKFADSTLHERALDMHVEAISAAGVVEPFDPELAAKLRAVNVAALAVVQHIRDRVLG